MGKRGAINRWAPQIIYFLYCTSTFDLFPHQTFNKSCWCPAKWTHLSLISIFLAQPFVELLMRTKTPQRWAAAGGTQRFKEPAPSASSWSRYFLNSIYFQGGNHNDIQGDAGGSVHMISSCSPTRWYFTVDAVEPLSSKNTQDWRLLAILSSSESFQNLCVQIGPLVAILLQVFSNTSTQGFSRPIPGLSPGSMLLLLSGFVKLTLTHTSSVNSISPFLNW